MKTMAMVLFSLLLCLPVSGDPIPENSTCSIWWTGSPWWAAPAYVNFEQWECVAPLAAHNYYVVGHNGVTADFTPDGDWVYIEHSTADEASFGRVLIAAGDDEDLRIDWDEPISVVTMAVDCGVDSTLECYDDGDNLLSTDECDSGPLIGVGYLNTKTMAYTPIEYCVLSSGSIGSMGFTVYVSQQ